MSDAVRYRRFLLDLIEPHCGSSVVEVGSGLGDLAADLRPRERLIVTDVDEACLAALRQRFDGRPGVEVMRLDLRDGVPLERPVDTALAVNVLEHIKDDVAALRVLCSSVVPGGTIVAWVPAYPALFGPHDRAAGHVRRYTPATMRRALLLADLQIERLHPVNFLGGLAWWLAVRIGRRDRPSPGLVRAYDRLVVPLTRFIERRWTPPFGQSLLAVARLPEPQ